MNVADSPPKLRIHSFDVEIPMPPSLNHAYANRKGVGRVKVASYRQWQHAAVAMIRVSVPAAKRIAGKINVHILLPVTMRGDCDNRIKPTLDALVASGRIDDDRNIQWVSARKCLLGNDNALVKVEAAA
jgi:crossover junction endodeoxyribonuclease RusA